MTATTPQAITEELRQWIVAQAQAGCLPEDVVKAMVASGWREDVAVEALEQTLREHLQALRAGTVAVPPGQPQAVATAGAASPALPVPEPSLHEGATVIPADGHPVQVLMNLRLPRVVLFGGLLTGDECDALIALARPRLMRSETVDTATGGSEVNTARTSDGMFFERGETPLIDRIERRIAALVNWPVERGEGLQILRYRPGAQYEPHHDYFDPARPGTPRILERGGQRVGTLVMYLNTPARGGDTIFPDAGLSIGPTRGSGVFFSYDRPHPDTRTLHGGAPVLAGEKWVATKWLRERTFS
jgi:prolyl 4-hydroxylase